MAIEDSLDKEMNRDDYKNEIIQEVINEIESDNISPKERAKMIDEYSDEKYLKKGRVKERVQTSFRPKNERNTVSLLSHRPVTEDWRNCFPNP